MLDIRVPSLLREFNNVLIVQTITRFLPDHPPGGLNSFKSYLRGLRVHLLVCGNKTQGSVLNLLTQTRDSHHLHARVAPHLPQARNAPRAPHCPHHTFMMFGKEVDCPGKSAVGLCGDPGRHTHQARHHRQVPVYVL